MSMCTSNGKDLNHLENQPNLFKEDFPNRSRDFSPVTTRRLGKRNIKVQVRKFRMETKAAKTLAIIVGGFIVCWLPFFTIYLYRGFCDGCVNDLLFSVLFWLGYCNSAVNPLVYALFSKDFRLAFKRIIWKCFCSTKYLKSEHKLRTTKLSPCLTPDVTPRSDTDLSVTRWRTFTCGSTTAGLTANGTECCIKSISNICHPIVMKCPTYLSNHGGSCRSDGAHSEAGVHRMVSDSTITSL